VNQTVAELWASKKKSGNLKSDSPTTSLLATQSMAMFTTTNISVSKMTAWMKGHLSYMI